MSGNRPPLFSADITDVARLQHLAGRYRPPVALLLAALSAASLGTGRAAAWIAAVLVSEAWT